jgi:transposase
MNGGNEEYALLVGLDWADRTHDLACLSVADGRRSHRRIGSSPESIREWMGEVSARYPGGRVAVCLEQSRGPAAYALEVYAAVDLYPVTPSVLNNYRKAFRPSGSKDDPLDAELCLDLLANHRDRLSKAVPDTEDTRKLRMLCELRRKTVDRRTRATNLLVSVLKQYYPQALKLVGDNRHSELACAFLMRWPRFESVAHAGPNALRKFYYAHHCRSERRIGECRQLVASSCALTADPAIVDPLVLLVGQLVGEIRLLNRAVKQYDRLVAELFDAQPDAALFRSFPGAGAQLRPRLLAAFGTDRKRYASAERLSAYSGVAPVVERSGRSVWTHWRWHCPKFVRQSFVEFAAKSIGQCAWAATHYRRQLERGKSHNAAVRSLAFKWQRIMFRCWRNREPYDEGRYLAALARHGSWIATEGAPSLAAPQTATHT